MSKVKIYDLNFGLIISKKDIEELRKTKDIWDSHTQQQLFDLAVLAYPWLKFEKVKDISMEWFEDDEVFLSITLDSDGKFLGDIEDAGKNPAAVALGRLGGSKGGKARTEKLSSERRSEISKKAAEARWSNNE